MRSYADFVLERSKPLRFLGSCGKELLISGSAVEVFGMSNKKTEVTDQL